MLIYSCSDAVCELIVYGCGLKRLMDPASSDQSETFCEQESLSSESLSSAHLSAHLQLTHQFTPSWCMKIRMKIEPQVDTWIPQDPPVWIKIPQRSSPLSSAPAHPSALLLEQQLYMSNIDVFLSQGGDIARSK